MMLWCVATSSSLVWATPNDSKDFSRVSVYPINNHYRGKHTEKSPKVDVKDLSTVFRLEDNTLSVQVCPRRKYLDRDEHATSKGSNKMQIADESGGNSRSKDVVDIIGESCPRICA